MGILEPDVHQDWITHQHFTMPASSGSLQNRNKRVSNTLWRHFRTKKQSWMSNKEVACLL
eukprot:752264-Hanusia_phi.AAC.8